MSRIYGEIAQLGYVVHDVEEAAAHWSKELGVGPFFFVPKLVVEDYRYRGVPHRLEFAVAVGNSGPLQIELIQPLGDTPSMWKEFQDAGKEGLQHVAYWTSDFDALIARSVAAGHTIVQEGTISGGRFAYLDTGDIDGTVVEISEQTGPKAALFQMVRDAAATWDGRDPFRYAPGTR